MAALTATRPSWSIKSRSYSARTSTVDWPFSSRWPAGTLLYSSMLERAWDSRPASRFLIDNAFAKVTDSTLRCSIFDPSLQHSSNRRPDQHVLAQNGTIQSCDTWESIEVRGRLLPLIRSEKSAPVLI